MHTAGFRDEEEAWMLVALLVVLVGSALALGLLAAAHRTLVLVIVDGLSMAPTYRSGDRALVLRRNGRRVGRGQVVVIERPEARHGWDRLPPPNGSLAGRHWCLKRVAAVAGDPVPDPVATAVGADADTRVPVGRLVVLGDGDPSDDSKQWGYFPADRVLGVVVRRLGKAPQPG